MCAKAQHIARSMPKCHRLASSSETKPCSIWRTCKEYTYIVGLSVCLHYGNIIWLPWQRPLTSWKIRFIICTQPALIWCKNCENRSSRSGDIRPYTPVYCPCRTRRSQISCQLWSYWTEFYEIFTRYTGIICAVSAHIEEAIS